jgi:hypothetical protein
MRDRQDPHAQPAVGDASEGGNDDAGPVFAPLRFTRFRFLAPQERLPDDHAGKRCLGSANMIDAVNRIGHAHAPYACATVGFVQVSPNSRNTIPGRVFFTVDFRHPEDAVLSLGWREIPELLDLDIEADRRGYPLASLPQVAVYQVVLHRLAHRAAAASASARHAPPGR